LKLPPLEPLLTKMADDGVTIRRARPFEISAVRAFIEEHFSVGWADEVQPCYSRQPISLYLATRAGRVIGFAAWESVMRGFFGPTGVRESERGKDIGKVLLLASLWGMREMGYIYGVIAGAGPTEFYSKCCGAVLIPDSTPGIYTDMLKAAPMPE